MGPQGQWGHKDNGATGTMGPQGQSNNGATGTMGPQGQSNRDRAATDHDGPRMDQGVKGRGQRGQSKKGNKAFFRSRTHAAESL